ncbi:MAG: HNH endonuclease, partial [Candidatus Eisenbacteria bacterium]|nr:HNH endonuclease [Candidatus Eisenbacteria bacterium]
LSAICLLASELTEENVASWIARACGQSKRAVERMLFDERRGQSVAPVMAVGGAVGEVVGDAAVGAGVVARGAAVDGDGRSGQTAFAEARPGPGSVAQGGRTSGQGSLLTDGAMADSVSASGPGSEAASLPDRAAPAPVGPARAGAAFSLPKLSFVADPELQDLLARARDLASHSNPNGDLATLLRLALRALIASTERRRFGQRVSERAARSDGGQTTGRSLVRSTERAVHRAVAHSRSAVSPEVGKALSPEAGTAVSPEAGPIGSPSAPSQSGGGHARATGRRRAPRWRSRYIPIAVRRAVWQRDGGRCAFMSRQGHRCGTRAFLQFHHLIPFAQGGAHTVENLALRCGAHNRYEARSSVGSADRSVDRAVVRSAGEDGWLEIGPLEPAGATSPSSDLASGCVPRGSSADPRNSPRGEECGLGAVVAQAVVWEAGCHAGVPGRQRVGSPA